MADWVDESNVFGASSTRDESGLSLSVCTVVTSRDELEVDWFIDNGVDEIVGGYFVPSEVGGLRAAFNLAKAAADARAIEVVSSGRSLSPSPEAPRG